MLLCKKCKMHIEDLSDGCSVCLKFKRERLTEDLSKDNSVLGDIDELRRVARSIVRHLTHVNKIKHSGNATEYDPELIKSLRNAQQIMSDVVRMTQRVQSDTKRQLMKMTNEQRNLMIAKALAGAPMETRLAILKLTEDPNLDSKSILDMKKPSVDSPMDPMDLD